MVVSPPVAYHEMEHGKIFRETPDGNIASAFSVALERHTVDEAILSSLNASLEILCEASRRPHEAFATYLSVKVMPSNDVGALMAKLTPEYEAYFGLLAGLLDRKIKTTFLQYLVAWNCAVIVFSSPLIERLYHIDLRAPLVLTPGAIAHIIFARRKPTKTGPSSFCAQFVICAQGQGRAPLRGAGTETQPVLLTTLRGLHAGYLGGTVPSKRNFDTGP